MLSISYLLSAYGNILQIGVIMRFIFKILFLFLFSSLFIIANASDNININKTIKEAKKENKNIMFYFHIPGCPYCKTMIDENFKDDTINSLIKENFILVDIYTADKKDVIFKNFKGSPKEFAQHIGAYAYPATLFMSKDGKIIYKAIGYRNIQEYINEIKYIATNSYKNMKLDEFILKMEIESDD